MMAYLAQLHRVSLRAMNSWGVGQLEQKARSYTPEQQYSVRSKQYLSARWKLSSSSFVSSSISFLTAFTRHSAISWHFRFMMSPGLTLSLRLMQLVISIRPSLGSRVTGAFSRCVLQKESISSMMPMEVRTISFFRILFSTSPSSSLGFSTLLVQNCRIFSPFATLEMKCISTCLARTDSVNPVTSTFTRMTGSLLFSPTSTSTSQNSRSARSISLSRQAKRSKSCPQLALRMAYSQERHFMGRKERLRGREMRSQVPLGATSIRRHCFLPHSLQMYEVSIVDPGWQIFLPYSSSSLQMASCSCPQMTSPIHCGMFCTLKD